MIDLSKVTDDGNYAIYLPAISSFYVKQLNKINTDPNYVTDGRIPDKFEFGFNGLDFLQPDSYYYYKYGLYSAGHANRNISVCSDVESMIHKRDKTTTTLIGDSGGFQLATGIIKLDWDKFKEKEGDKFRQEILDYLEFTADWAMTLDVPALAAESPMNKKTKLKSFYETLEYSIINLEYFIKNRTKKSRFLNVLSGSNKENSKFWYEAVKHFSDPKLVKALGYNKDNTFEGYAFAGINMRSMYVTLSRILDLINEGLLENKDWIHFLGIGRLDWSCYLTSIMRILQEYYNPNLKISFDAASPFVATAYGLCYNYNYFTPKKFMYAMDKAIDNKTFKNSNLQCPFTGPIMDRLLLKDLCVLGENDTNKNGKTTRTSWDTISYLLYMSHNVYNHITAVQEANRLADIEYTRKPLSYKDWSKQSKSSTLNDVSIFVPSNILFFDSFVKELLRPGNKYAYKFLEENKAFLDSISFHKSNNIFNNLFDSDSYIPSEDELADINNEKLMELENNE